MKMFIAKNPKQLDLCLKLMFTERIPFSVTVKQTAKLKIIYEIEAKVDDDKSIELERKYMILIS